MRLPTLLLLAACGSAELSTSPESLTFGEIDFNEDRPDGGYAPLELRLSNIGSRDLDLTLPSVEDRRLIIGARFEESPRLPTLEPGQDTVLTIGIAEYEPGELTTTVEGTFLIRGEQLRDDVRVPYSYQPTRN